MSTNAGSVTVTPKSTTLENIGKAICHQHLHQTQNAVDPSNGDEGSAITKHTSDPQTFPISVNKKIH